MRQVLHAFLFLSLMFMGSASADSHQHEKEHGTHKDEKASEFSIEDSELPRLGIVLKKVAPGHILHGINVAGKIIPIDSRISHVAPRFGGVIKDVKARVGDLLEAGAQLATIQNNQNLQSFAVTAAKKGVVIDRHATIGESVAETDTLFIVADLSEVWAELAVDRREVASIRVGQKVKVTVSASSASEIGEVFFVAPVTDEVTQSTFIRVKLNNRSGQFPPGAFVRAMIATSETEVSRAVESHAIAQNDGKRTVFVRAHDTFELHPVTTGQSDEDLTEILQGVEVGEVYASGNTDFLSSSFLEDEGRSHEEEDAHEDAHDAEHEHEEEGALEEGDVKLSEDAISNAGIVIEEAGPTKLKVKLALNGEVAPNADKLAHVTPRFPGIIKETRKNVGDVVKQGEVIAIVESNQSVLPYEIVAPISGKILERHATNGEFNSGVSPIFVIGNLEEVWIDLIVPEDAASRVLPGQTLLIANSQENQGALSGTISFLSPVLDETTQSRFARAVIPNVDGHLLPGAFSSGELIVDDSAVSLAVKDAGIQKMEGRPVIFVQDKQGVFRKREIVIGRQDGVYTEVLKGLRPGERYIATNSFLIKAELGKGEAEHDH